MAIRTRRVLTCGVLATLLSLGVGTTCLADQNGSASQYPHGYGAVEAGQEAYHRAEIGRRMAIDHQRNLNEALKADLQPAAEVPVEGRAAGVEVEGVAVSRVAWVRRRAFRYGPPAVVLPAPPLRAYRGVLEPWPALPGPLYRYPYGYPWGGYYPQPTGQIHIQIGPGVILSRPQYGAPVEPGLAPQGVPTPAPPRGQPEPVPAPAPEGPALDVPAPPAGVPPAPAPGPPPAPAPAPAPGPQEF